MMAVAAPHLRNLTDDEIWDRLHHGMVDLTLLLQAMHPHVGNEELGEAHEVCRKTSGRDGESRAVHESPSRSPRDLGSFTDRLAKATRALAVITALLVASAALQVPTRFKWQP